MGYLVTIGGSMYGIYIDMIYIYIYIYHEEKPAI